MIILCSYLLDQLWNIRDLAIIAAFAAFPVGWIFYQSFRYIYYLTGGYEKRFWHVPIRKKIDIQDTENGKIVNLDKVLPREIKNTEIKNRKIELNIKEYNAIFHPYDRLYKLFHNKPLFVRHIYNFSMYETRLTPIIKSYKSIWHATWTMIWSGVLAIISILLKVGVRTDYTLISIIISSIPLIIPLILTILQAHRRNLETDAFEILITKLFMG